MTKVSEEEKKREEKVGWDWKTWAAIIIIIAIVIVVLLNSTPRQFTWGA